MSFSRQTLNWALLPEWLGDRMSFIAGPRQVGKTTAIENYLNQRGVGEHFYNWDALTTRRRFAANPLFFLEDLPLTLPRPWVAFDEIHKYPKWKNILKGYYDELKKKVRFIITGSARLDWFRKSGDSLVGRYFLFKMFPLGPLEIAKTLPSPSTNPWHPMLTLPPLSQPDSSYSQAMEELINMSGFPEPFFKGSHDFYSSWSDNHLSLILREDLRDLTKIVQIKKLETLLYLLPERVGSPLSLNSLKGLLECAHGTLASWLEALKVVYLIFSLPAWTKQLSRSVLKEEKYYFWDWGMVEKPGGRFENFMAVQLQRIVASWNERGKGGYQLYYVRTKDKEEVDFAIADRKKVHLLVEAKEQEENLSSHLVRFKERLQVPLAIQVIRKKGVCQERAKDLFVMSADRFLYLME